MGIVSELEELGAPRNVLDAGKEIEASQAARVMPNSSLVEFVRQWVGRANSQDRWGK